MNSAINSIGLEKRVVGIRLRHAGHVYAASRQFCAISRLPRAITRVSSAAKACVASRKVCEPQTGIHIAVKRRARSMKRTSPKPPEAIVLATKPCTATCVIDGIAVTLTFFPDTGVLRITDSTGSRLRETRWSASWQSLVATFRELSETPVEERADPDVLFGSYYRSNAISSRYAN